MVPLEFTLSLEFADGLAWGSRTRLVAPGSPFLRGDLPGQQHLQQGQDVLVQCLVSPEQG